jgi:hypothetical protein
LAISRQRNPTKFSEDARLERLLFRRPRLSLSAGHIQMLGRSHGETIAAGAGSWARLTRDIPFELRGPAAVAGDRTRAEVTLTVTVLPVRWTGDWHENPKP